MVARVQQSAHQIHMIAADLPPHMRGDTDSGVSYVCNLEIPLTGTWHLAQWKRLCT